MNHSFYICTFAFVSALLLPAGCLATDIIVLSNGDRLRGDIKKLDKNTIIVATDYSGEDFKIKWDKVVRIESERHFLVEDFSGDRITGSLKPDPADEKVIAVGDERIRLADTAFMRPFETSLRSRIDASTDFGFNLTKANSVKQLSAGTNVAYTGEKSVATLGANVFFNSQSNAPRTRRWEITPDYRRLFGRSWFAAGNANFFSSEEQKLDLRSTFGGGVGRYFFRSTSRYLAVIGGLAWTRERYSDPAVPLRNSAEAFGSAEYLTKRFKLADILARLNVFPNLTDTGRYRVNFTSDVAFHLPGTWYMKTGYYNNFDSAPPATLPRNDFGWRNSFGFKF